MGVIAPKRKPGNAYFGCGGAACLGLVFWAFLTFCLVVTVVGLSTEVSNGNPEQASAFYALSQILVGSLAFCFSMAAILLVFVGFGFFRQTHQFDGRGETHSLNSVMLFFFLFVAGMILAAALPTLVLEIPGLNGWVITIGFLTAGAYLLYGMLMLWLALVAYESYRYGII